MPDCYYTFDVVGEFTFAKKLGFLQEGRDVDSMIKATEVMLLYASLCGQIPEAHPFLLGNPLFHYLLPSMDTWNQVLQSTLKAINSRLSLRRDGEPKDCEKTGGKDMMSHWMAIHKADPENFPRAMSLFTYPPMCSLALTQQQSPSAQLYTSLSAAQKRWRKCKQKSMLQTTKANSAIQSHTRKPSPSSLSWSGAEGVHAPPSIHGP